MIQTQADVWQSVSYLLYTLPLIESTWILPFCYYVCSYYVVKISFIFLFYCKYKLENCHIEALNNEK